jgi:hypothetical protein
MSDGERQIEADLSSRDLRQRHASAFAERRDKAGRFSLDHDIPVLPLTTEHDVAGQLRELLGRRLQRKAV